MNATVWAALSAAVFALGATDTRAATACEESTDRMRSSCLSEAQEELSATLAKCVHLPSAAGRRTCRRDADAARAETLEECADQHEARIDACDLLGEHRYADPLLDSAISFIDPDEIPGTYPNNPYVKLEAGHTHLLRSEDETVVVHATDESREILGVLCRVVVDVVVEEVFEDGEREYTPVEVTDDWFAQSTSGDVYYCGEVSRDFEDGVLRDLGGSFEAGLDYAMAGVLTLAAPTAGKVHRQEFALGEAEDIVRYVAVGTKPTAAEGGEVPNFPCRNTCLKTFDFTPLEPDSSEFKYYLPGVGFILGLGMEDGTLTGSREELVCHGDSLDVLEEAACGIADPDELLDELCELHDAFCD